MLNLHLICAARPNYMKVAPLHNALKQKKWCNVSLIHTGQHYDPLLFDVFFTQLNLPAPHFSLGVGSGTHAEQTAKTMLAYEPLCNKQKPDLVIVVGDVNATLACSLTAKKLNLKVAHLEAGLRSNDLTMPEEINRLMTDHISDILWTPSEDASINLKNEGIEHAKIKNVGNIMIDSLELLKPSIEKSNQYEKFGLQKNEYIVLTLHRPVNVDNLEKLSHILDALSNLELTIIFPIHPRSKKSLQIIDASFSKTIPEAISLKKWPKIKFIDALPYIEFMNLISNSRLVITDSGGIQEETTYLNIPCFTLRNSTERPVTITHGTNKLVNVENVIEEVCGILQGKTKIQSKPIPLWDGIAAHRITEHIEELYG